MLGFCRHPIILSLVLGSITAAPICTPSSAEDWSGLREEFGESVLYIRAVTRNLDGTNEKIADAATGFVVTPRGHVITVSHVMPPPDDTVELFYLASPGPSDPKPLKLTFIARDTDSDVALFQLPPVARDWRPVVFASSASLPDDINLLVLGFPLSQQLSSTNGILSNRYGPNGRFQTNIPLNPGNSGGPAFDIGHRVIGMAWGALQETSGITYITPSDLLRQILSKAGVEFRIEDDAVGLVSLVERANVYLAAQEWDLAIEQLNRAIRIDPKYVPALKKRGQAFLGKKAWDLSISDYSAAILLEPKYGEHFYNRGSAYLGRDDYSRALKDFDEAIRLNFHDKALALYWRGITRQQIGDRAEGQADIAAAKKIDPNVGK